MTVKTKHIAIPPVSEDSGGALPAIVVPRLMRIQDAAKYLNATTWQVETLLREKIIPSFVLGKRRVVDRLELDRYVERRSAMAKTEMSAAHE
jgi:excisionase family DNA binding protein